MARPSILVCPDTAALISETRPAADTSAVGGSIAVSIVSNSCLLREGLTTLLSAHLDLRVVGCYGGAVESAPVCANPPEHVVLLDSSVGRDAAIGWTRYWRGLPPPAHVVVLELANNTELILECIEAGASGYTLQGASVAEVAAAIECARCGVAHCSPEVTARLFRRLAALREVQTQPALHDVPLTARELEVLRYIAADYSNQAIAVALVIEVRTVKHHVHNILEKLKLHHRGEAASLAVERGWIAPSPERLRRARI